MQNKDICKLCVYFYYCGDLNVHIVTLWGLVLLRLTESECYRKESH